MLRDQCITDSGHGVTVLYYKNVSKGYKFIGDDPEGRVIPIDKETREKVYKETGITGSDPNVPARAYLDKFYLHNRCLLFPSGVWMSETAKYPQYLRYRPGANLSFRVSGLTRFTSLTENGGALCVGIDPDAKKMPCLRRFVHVIDVNTVFQPQYPHSYLIPTENCVYGGKEVKEGSIIKSHHDPHTAILEKKGYIIEYAEEPFTMEEAVLNYAGQWITKHIEVFDR